MKPSTRRWMADDIKSIGGYYERRAIKGGPGWFVPGSGVSHDIETAWRLAQDAFAGRQDASARYRNA